MHAFPSQTNWNLHFLCGHIIWTRKFAWGVKAKHCWALSTNHCIQKFVDNSQQCFAFTTFPPIIWIFTKVMGSNPGYLLKSFLLYQTLLWWKQIKCIHVKIESRCKLRNKLIEKLVFCRALQKGTTPFIRYTWFESFYGFTSLVRLFQHKE